MWFKKKVETKPSFSVGGYVLNMTLEEGPPLLEFSSAEYAVMGRRFVGEKIYHAPEIKFVGKRWKLNLGVVQDTLYKIAPYLELTSKTQANEAAMAVLTFCNERLGKSTKQNTGFFLWDTSDGNVILQTAMVGDGFDVNLFLTARNARGFRQL